MPKINFRKAKSSDIPTLVEFKRELANHHHALDRYYNRGSVVVKHVPEVLRKNLSDRAFHILIAEIHGIPVGFFAGKIQERVATFSVSTIGYVSEAYVSKAYRRLGVAELGLKELFRWFRKHKVHMAELNVDSRNKLGLRAWKGIGFEEYQKRMRRKIG